VDGAWDCLSKTCVHADYKNSVFCLMRLYKTNRRMLYGATNAVYCQHHTKHIAQTHVLLLLLTVLYLKNVLSWPEYDRLRSKHVAIMWPECMYVYIYIIYDCTDILLCIDGI